MGHPRPLFHLILVFFKQTSLQFLQQVKVKKYPSSMWCQDSNPRSRKHESSPITALSLRYVRVVISLQHGPLAAFCQSFAQVSSILVPSI